MVIRANNTILYMQILLRQQILCACGINEHFVVKYCQNLLVKVLCLIDIIRCQIILATKCHSLDVKNSGCRSSCHGSVVNKSIVSKRMQVRSLAWLSGLRIQCCPERCVGCRHGSDLALLWLWCRPAAIVLI